MFILIPKRRYLNTYNLGFGASAVVRNTLAKANMLREPRIFEEFAFYMVSLAQQRRLTKKFYVIIICLFHGANIHIYFDWRAYTWKIICRAPTITNLPYHYLWKNHGRFVIIRVFSRKNSHKEIVIPTKVPHKHQTRLTRFWPLFSFALNRSLTVRLPFVCRPGDGKRPPNR